MSASLVGSEMCIRDSPWTVLRSTQETNGPAQNNTFLASSMPQQAQARAVSYTHLTLPTICSV
eukprot:13852783-Alexandrium_andersonii.AAC.1